MTSQMVLTIGRDALTLLLMISMPVPVSYTHLTLPTIYSV